MWDCKRQVFHKEEIKLTSENLVYMGVINKNTIIVQSDLNYFKLLLRWKNHKGVLFPAWQISTGLISKLKIM
jgi:hypothetical protein